MAEPLNTEPTPEEQGQLPYSKRDPWGYVFHTIADASARSSFGSSLLELERGERTNHRYRQMADKAEGVASSMMAEGRVPYSDVEAWRNLPEETRGDFLGWLMRNNDTFRLRFEKFTQDILPLTISPTAAEELDKYRTEENIRRQQAVAVEQATQKIEDLSEEDIRLEIVRRITSALGKLHIGPTLDGTALSGFNRPQGADLWSSYFRYLKIFDENEKLVAVKIELYGVMDANHPEFQAIDENVFSEDSGYNRYYLIPIDTKLPGKVSVESFLTHKGRINQTKRERDDEQANWVYENFLQHMQEDVKGVKHASLQDYRDALSLVRRSDWFVKQVLYDSPPEAWQRPDVTE